MSRTRKTVIVYTCDVCKRDSYVSSKQKELEEGPPPGVHFDGALYVAAGEHEAPVKIPKGYCCTDCLLKTKVTFSDFLTHLAIAIADDDEDTLDLD